MARRINALKDKAAAAANRTPPNWVETPGWLFGAGEPSILLPYDDVSGQLDLAALAAVTRKDYLALIAAVVTPLAL